MGNCASAPKLVLNDQEELILNPGQPHAVLKEDGAPLKSPSLEVKVHAEASSLELLPFSRQETDLSPPAAPESSAVDKEERS